MSSACRGEGAPAPVQLGLEQGWPGLGKPRRTRTRCLLDSATMTQ